MGTLFEQPERLRGLSIERVVSRGFEIKRISDELNISFNEAIDLYLAIAKIDDYEVKDEQLAGFGELFRNFIEVYESK